MNCKVALVDDSNAFCLLVESLLRMEGIVLDAFPDAESFLARTTKHEEYDLFLFDLNLPGMGGLEMLQRVKEQSRLTSIPVLLLTGDATKETVQQAAKIGINGYVSKPITPDEFVGRVVKLLQG